MSYQQISSWDTYTITQHDIDRIKLQSTSSIISISTDQSEGSDIYPASRTSSVSTLAEPLEQEIYSRDDQKSICTFDQSVLHIDEQRLWSDIHYTAQWGAIGDGLGMARLTLTDEDKRVRDYVVAEAISLGCQVRIDQIGNIFAVLPGENNEIAPIGIGSHLDTQPAGGRFDGILGVLAALEVLRTIRSSGIKTYAPIAAINWTNEEGARFTPGCTGSAVWAGHITLSQAHDLYDTTDSCTMKQELERIDYLGETPANYASNPLSAHFELHIEQRRRLQDADREVGIVTGIQGVRWYRVTINGERGHAGSAMRERGDALMATAGIVTSVQKKALQVEAVATVGVLELDRPSLNTVPGTTTFTIDIRHPSEIVLDDFESCIRAYMSELRQENDKIDYHMERLWRSPAVVMHETAMSCTRTAASKVVGTDSTMDLLSLAGHDSALVAMRVPTSMIFVPCRDGISHSPDEYSSRKQCATGAQVLLEAVLEFDQHLRASHQEITPGQPT